MLISNVKNALSGYFIFILWGGQALSGGDKGGGAPGLLDVLAEPRGERGDLLCPVPVTLASIFRMDSISTSYRRSAEVTKEGGHLVYSTCSLNPVENEAVVAAVVAAVPPRKTLASIVGTIPSRLPQHDRSHEERGCSILRPSQSRISPSNLREAFRLAGTLCCSDGVGGVVPSLPLAGVSLNPVENEAVVAAVVAAVPPIPSPFLLIASPQHSWVFLLGRISLSPSRALSLSFSSPLSNFFPLPNAINTVLHISHTRPAR